MTTHWIAFDQIRTDTPTRFYALTQCGVYVHDRREDAFGDLPTCPDCLELVKQAERGAFPLSDEDVPF